MSRTHLKDPEWCRDGLLPQAPHLSLQVNLNEEQIWVQKLTGCIGLHAAAQVSSWLGWLDPGVVMAGLVGPTHRCRVQEIKGQALASGMCSTGLDQLPGQATPEALQ